jgi:hypothetical protein
MSEQPGKIYAAINAVMRDIDCIGKVRRNQQQHYSFRGIDDVYNAVHEPLAKHGVFIVPSVLERSQIEKATKTGGCLFYTVLKVSHKFYANDGSYVEAITCGEAMDSGDKSTNKAMSAAMKYAILEVFAIPTEGDNDSENHSPEPVAGQPTPPAARQAPATTPTARPAAKTRTPANKPPSEPTGAPEGAGNHPPAEQLTMVIEEVIAGVESKDKTFPPKNGLPGKPFTQWAYKSPEANCTLTSIKDDIGNALLIAQEDGLPRKITYTPTKYGGTINKIEM